MQLCRAAQGFGQGGDRLQAADEGGGEDGINLDATAP